MRTTNNAIDIIKRYEGLKLKAYKCPAGIWTIGYGHTSNVKKGDSISKSQAEELLLNDIKFFEEQVEALTECTLINQNQFDALVSFAFNLGIANLKKSTLLKKIKVNPDDITIRKEFLKWVYANGEKLNGLIARRECEANLYFS